MIGNTNVENTLERLNCKHTQLANERGRCESSSTCLAKHLYHVGLFPHPLLHIQCYREEMDHSHYLSCTALSSKSESQSYWEESSRIGK